MRLNGGEQQKLCHGEPMEGGGAGSSLYTRWDNNHNDEDNDADNQAYAHLHILPPHLFPHSVRTSSEALSRDGKVIGLVLERI